MQTYEGYLRNRENRLRNRHQGNGDCIPQEFPFCSCSDSRIRLIYRTEQRNVFAGNVFLDCTGLCGGRDSDTVLEWRLNRISGNVAIQGPINQETITVIGTGEFTLTLNALFRCRYFENVNAFEDCPRTLTSGLFRL